MRQLSQPRQKQVETAHSPRRFANGENTASVPKCSAVSGAENASTAREAAIVVTGTRSRLCSRRPKAAIMLRVSGSARRTIPAIAEKDICRLILAQLKGLISRISASAVIRDVGPSFSRRKIGAITRIVCITPARTAEGGAPVMNTKNQTSRIPAIDDIGRAPKSSWIIPTRNATCMPETATMCIKPAPRMRA